MTAAERAVSTFQSPIGLEIIDMTSDCNTNSTHPVFQIQQTNHLPEDLPCPENNFARAEILNPLAHQASLSFVEKCLQKQSLLRLQGDHRGERLINGKGVVWVTQSGVLEDIFLNAGETLAITRKGPVLIEGMSEARVKITHAEAPPEVGRTLGGAVRRIAASLFQYFG